VRESVDEGNEVDGIQIRTNQEVLSMDSRSEGTSESLIREEGEHEGSQDMEVMKMSKMMKEMTQVSSNHPMRNEFLGKLRQNAFILDTRALTSQQLLLMKTSPPGWVEGVSSQYSAFSLISSAKLVFWVGYQGFGDFRVYFSRYLV
jgi:hypothetical protein